MATAARIRQAASALASVRPDLGADAKLILLAQPLQESQYGDVIETPTGASSYNWGMIYTKGDLGTIPVGDTQDGIPFKANAAWNSSDEAGARQYVSLLQRSYPEALAAAERGKLFAFAKGLWRGGPGSSRPSYYGGFPPGHKYSLAPKGTDLHSDLDHYYRILAYKRYVEAGARAVSSATGIPFRLDTSEPRPPAAVGGVPSSWFWGIVGVGTATLAGLYGWKSGWWQGVTQGLTKVSHRISKG